MECDKWKFYELEYEIKIIDKKIKDIKKEIKDFILWKKNLLGGKPK
jgi:hypothetical protein